jgi:hypothetical protein
MQKIYFGEKILKQGIRQGGPPQKGGSPVQGLARIKKSIIE